MIVDRSKLFYLLLWQRLISISKDVLRNWHSREEKIIETMKALIDNTVKAEEIILKGELK